jgi:hypothetical protein
VQNQLEISVDVELERIGTGKDSCHANSIGQERNRGRMDIATLQVGEGRREMARVTRPKPEANSRTFGCVKPEVLD